MRQIVIALFLVTGLFAQFPGDPNDRPEPGMPPDEPRQRNFDRREKIEELRIWKMTNYLNLSSEQAIRFFPILKEHEDRMFTIIDSQRDLLEKLIEQCNDDNYNPTDKEITEILETHEKFDSQIKQEKADFVKNKLDFLSNQQKVKYIVFDSRFKSHLLRALKEHNQK